ncbi:MAG: hypothetical protein WAM01_07210, partial [Candidatus Acidiferrales bacterium]
MRSFAGKLGAKRRAAGNGSNGLRGRVSGGGAGERGNFAGRKGAIGAGREAIERDGGDGDAFHLIHGMIGVEKFSAQRVTGRFGERDFVPRIVLPRQAGNARAGGRSQLFGFLKSEQRSKLDMPGLRQTMGLQEAIGEIAVIGKQDESGSMVFEAADGKDTLGNAVEQLAEAAAAFGIGKSGDDFGGFMEREINALTIGRRGFRLNEASGNLDVIARGVGFGAEFGDGASVDGNQARGDKGFGVAARGQAGAGNDFLKAFEHEERVAGFGRGD